jgi:hypothetical protein
VNTVRAPDGQGNKDTDESFGGALFLNLTSFLSANSIRAWNSLDGIDWCSSNNSTPSAVAHISVPILVMSMQGPISSGMASIAMKVQQALIRILLSLKEPLTA